MNTLERMWQEYHSRLRAFIRRRISDDAATDDILQDVFLKMHDGLASLKDATKLQNWLYQIARNAVADYYRMHQSKAVPFVETPNLTLRRLFNLNGKPVKSEKSSSQIIQDQRIGRVRKKKPKTDLPKLVQAGLLKDGQSLYLLDYQGKKIPGYDSTISGKNLLWNNELFSMSELAKECLKKEGFSSESVRGPPAHWSNADGIADGISVKELWKQYLKAY